jgi:hypothetical protein
MCRGFWSRNLRERDHWNDLDVDGWIILRWMEGRNMHRIVVGRPNGKRSLGRPRRVW